VFENRYREKFSVAPANVLNAERKGHCKAFCFAMDVGIKFNAAARLLPVQVALDAQTGVSQEVTMLQRLVSIFGCH
jgi:hypothetical protein